MWPRFNRKNLKRDLPLYPLPSFLSSHSKRLGIVQFFIHKCVAQILNSQEKIGVAGRKTQSAIFTNDFTFQRQSCWKAHASKRRKVEKRKKREREETTREREEITRERERERDAESREIARRTRIENRETSKRDLSLCRRFEWQTSKGCRPSVKRSNAPVKKALTYGAFSREGEVWKRQTREGEKSFFQESKVTFRSVFENGDFLEMSMPRAREICFS